jgi:hypothetical protein
VNKPFKAASPRFYVLVATTVALATSAALFLAGAVGAGSNASTAEGISAQPATAGTATAKVVNVASLPRITGASGKPSIAQAGALVFRSPLGKTGLATAKKKAAINAPTVEASITTGPRTPAALGGFDGMHNSGPICP